MEKRFSGILPMGWRPSRRSNRQLTARSGGNPVTGAGDGVIGTSGIDRKIVFPGSPCQREFAIATENHGQANPIRSRQKNPASPKRPCGVLVREKCQWEMTLLSANPVIASRHESVKSPLKSAGSQTVFVGRMGCAGEAISREFPLAWISPFRTDAKRSLRQRVCPDPVREASKGRIFCPDTPCTAPIL